LPEKFSLLEYDILNLTDRLFMAKSQYYTIGLYWRSALRHKFVDSGINWMIPHVLHLVFTRLGVEYEVEERTVFRGRRYRVLKKVRVNCRQLQTIGRERFMATVRQVIKDIYSGKIKIKKGEHPWRKEAVVAGYNVQ
jgi:hypothetical protein